MLKLISTELVELKELYRKVILVSFVDPKDSRMLSEIEKSIKLNIPRRNL